MLSSCWESGNKQLTLLPPGPITFLSPKDMTPHSYSPPIFKEEEEQGMQPVQEDSVDIWGELPRAGRGPSQCPLRPAGEMGSSRITSSGQNLLLCTPSDGEGLSVKGWGQAGWHGRASQGQML